MNSTARDRVRATCPDAIAVKRAVGVWIIYRTNISPESSDEIGHGSNPMRAWENADERMKAAPATPARLPKQPTKRPTSKPIPRAALPEPFLQHMRLMAKYWASLPGLTKLQACDGLAFSILSAIDGAAALAPITLVQGNRIINADLELHDLYFDDEIRDRK